MLEKIVSGGQTGADRAALDFASRHGLPHGGWCPQGRRAEDGIIDGKYHLTETPSPDYAQRTEWNVHDSDGTVVFTLAEQASGGSLFTIQCARKFGRPCLHLSHSTAASTPAAAEALRAFVREHDIRVLNVAGSRESGEPGIGEWVRDVLEEMTKSK